MVECNHCNACCSARFDAFRNSLVCSGIFVHLIEMDPVLKDGHPNYKRINRGYSQMAFLSDYHEL